MKIIFLDLDGAILTEQSYQLPLVLVEECLPFRQWGYPQLDPRCVENLNIITATTGAKLVLSSTWRICKDDEFDRIIKYLHQQGVNGEVIGRTIPKILRCRGEEIQNFLDLHLVERYVIIDDDDDMKHLTPCLVKTTWERGLEDHHTERAIKLLGYK